MITLTDKNFKEEVEDYGKPVFIDFWSAYCEPCKVQMPIVEELAKVYKDKIKICRLEVGDNPEAPAKYQILSIPALAIFQNGKITDQKLGLQSKNSLIKMIENVL